MSGILFDIDDLNAREQILLENDGLVIYYPNFVPKELSIVQFQQLLNQINWRSEFINMFGKEIETKRKFSWMGDKCYNYTYSKTNHIAESWHPIVLQLKTLIESSHPYTFNSCLLNRYLDGTEAMGWHSDDEPTMLKHGAIASLSFGAARKMEFKHKLSGEKRSIVLEQGSMLLMLNQTQENWLHQITKTRSVKDPRINLTFRTFVELT